MNEHDTKIESVDPIRVMANSVIFLAGIWLITRVSKELFKELEGLGL
jgi:hypothetical protein